MGGREPILFFQRKYPSANMVLVRGKRPVLVDTGFGSDLPETETLLREAGTPPESLAGIINTHYHCDHVGGNNGLQRKYGLQVAAHRWDASLINRRDREACCAEWLDQPIEPYRVDMPLNEGDIVDTEGVILQVLHTPSHTQGHISLYAPDHQTLLCGDVFHGDDVGWINIFREGIASIQLALEALDRFAALPLQRCYSGHGAMIEQPQAAINTARRRYEKWLTQPDKVIWHASKRIFAYALMLYRGIPKENVEHYLISCAWFQDFSRYMDMQPEEFIQPLLDEMFRSGAAGWRDGRLVALTPFVPPSEGWLAGPSRPANWPRL